MRGVVLMRSRRRGFTLVEIAIAMAVIGLLLGATAVTSRHLEEKRQLQREMQRLEIVRDAIVGYAIRNRTRERTIKIITAFGPRTEWTFRLPAGRPYLPCPDWNGDGYEDRVPLGAHGFMQGMEVKPDLTVTATVGAFAGDNSLAWVSDSSPLYTTLPYGECRVARGTVPWRTLGVAPSDGWGNRHTYFADPVFSNAIFGFDRQTVADIYDPRVPSAPGFSPAQRRFKYQHVEVTGHPRHLVPPDLGFLSPWTFTIGCPAAICNGANCAPERHIASERDDIGRCAWHGAPTFIPGATRIVRTFKGGLATPEDIPDGRKPFPAGGVTDGLPFVLVSHGPNGRFAVNHWASLDAPLLRLPGAPSVYMWQLICNVSSGTPFYSGNDAFDIRAENRAEVQEAMNAIRLRVGSLCIAPRARDEMGERVNFNPSAFVWHPPGIRDRDEFDDLLAWATRGELTRGMGRIPHLPQMHIAYFP